MNSFIPNEYFIYLPPLMNFTKPGQPSPWKVKPTKSDIGRQLAGLSALANAQNQAQVQTQQGLNPLLGAGIAGALDHGFR